MDDLLSRQISIYLWPHAPEHSSNFEWGRAKRGVASHVVPLRIRGHKVMKSDELLKSILRTKFNGPCLRFGHHSLVPYGVIHHGRKEPRERMRMSSPMFGRGFEGKTPHPGFTLRVQVQEEATGACRCRPPEPSHGGTNTG